METAVLFRVHVRLRVFIMEKKMKVSYFLGK